MLDAVRQEGLSGDLRRHRGFFDRTILRVGGVAFSLAHIEHGLLRCNRPAPWTFWPVLARHDPRLSWQLQAFDPRIHFALNCGARSCPPIRAYEPGQWDAQLDLATRSYLSSAGVSGGALVLPALLRLYSRDFPDPAGFAASMLPEPLDPVRARRLPIRWARYDWTVGS